MDPSIVNYLVSQGQPADYASRASLAASKGIQNYVGSAEQNTQLLNMLRGSTTPTATTQTTPQTTPQSSTTPATTSAVTGQPKSAQDLVNMGYQGYTGWGDAEALADFKATGGSGKGGPSANLSQPSIDLQGIYQGLYDKSGIADLDKQLADMTKKFNDAQSNINDNPFLSEASRVGRLQKLQTDFNNNTAGVRDQIATKKADIETQLNLQMKQFDINSQQAQLAFSQFQNLLSSGALDNASGDTIAALTRSTGLSSQMIYSAIEAQKKKNISTTIQQFDDGKNQGYVVINSQTGDIINKQIVGASKPSTSTADSKTADSQQTTQNLISDIQKGSTLQAVVDHYSVAGGLDIETIYRLYNTYSPYGKAGESLDNVKKGIYYNG